MTANKRALVSSLLLIKIILLRHLSISTKINPSERAFSLFEVVRFPNDPCISDPNDTDGTCYTINECQQKKGMPGSSCASGFGVCCIFRHGCDSLSTENITYFTSPQTNNVKEPNICRLQICPCGANICQLRLDFISFAILPPDNGNSGVIGRILNGAPTSKANGLEVTSSTRCNSESFSVSNPGGTTPPVICGMNDGYHMYVDTNSNCNDLTFLLDGSSDNSNWLIKVTQYDCFYSNLAPSGCTQWFFGPLTNDVTSFNYQGGLHLANQDQRICVRREANTCQICWTTSDPLDFQLSGPGTMALTDDNICCNYDFNLKLGFDCLIIPTATSFANEKQLNANYFCGASKGLGAVGSRTAANTGIVRPNSLPNKSICSRSLPFSITFRSDNYEFMEESAKSPKGFRLFYILNKCS